jgi:N4-gp56 family major capsid protein
MAITKYGDTSPNLISPRIGVYAAVKMLKHAEPILILEKFSQARPMPANKGQQIKFRRPVPFTVSTVALNEGVTPSSQQMGYEDVTATLAQYGAWVQLTDVIADTHEDPVLNDSAMLCGEQAAETRELLNWGVLKAGTAVTYANGTQRNQVNTTMSLADIRSVVRTLRAQRCKPITKMLNGSVDIGTKPVEAGYIAFGHTDIEADLRGLAGFTPLAEYGSRQPLCEYESGTVENVRFVLSPLFAPIANGGGSKGTHVSTTGTSADVYQTVIMGQEAWGTVPLKGKDSITPMILNPGIARGGDELGQRGSVAWKTWHTSVVLNEAWLNRIESAVTDL